MLLTTVIITLTGLTAMSTPEGDSLQVESVTISADANVGAELEECLYKIQSSIEQ